MPPWPGDPCHGVIGMTHMAVIGLSIAAGLGAVKLPLDPMACSQSMRRDPGPRIRDDEKSLHKNQEPVEPGPFLGLTMTFRPPLLDKKDPSSPSVFQPHALLRETRRQKGLPSVDVPAICILDPDGDIVRRLTESGDARQFQHWPCYHTHLDTFTLAGQTTGIIASVFGAPFAVLVAEELFASGCRLLVNLTSAGHITPAGQTPYFVLIDRALRDEGTSYHYAAPSEYGEADPPLIEMASEALRENGCMRSWGRAGPLTHRFARPPAPSRMRGRKGCSPSRWKLLPCTRLRAWRASACFASLKSPTPWVRQRRTSPQRPIYPSKADTPLAIDPDAHLLCPISLEDFR
jgi:hypothetical protein